MITFPSGIDWPMRLKLVRTLKGQTQEDVANELNTTRKTVYNWEYGKATPDEYYRAKLSQWAGVPEEKLFKGVDLKRR